MNEVKIDFAVGGQAVLEGVMMRSPNFYTVSVRNSNGEIKMKQEKFSGLSSRFKFFKLPLIRGMVQLVESMIIGFRALNFSNEIVMGEDDKENVPRKGFVGWLKNMAEAVFSVLYIVISIGFTLFMLKFLPLWIAEKASDFWPTVKENYLIFNSIDGLTKISIFIGYILLISLLADIRRVFQYHGAEHMSVWTYEKGLGLTVENAKKQSRFHPRCGTSFIFIVIFMSVMVYTLIPPAETFAGKLAERVAVLPLIAGISYEFLKFSAKLQNNPLIKLFILPGLLIQKLTTKVPDDKQLEVALNSLKESLSVEANLKKFGEANIA